MTTRKELMELLKDLPDGETWLDKVMDRLKDECPHCKDYKAMYIKVRDELAAEQQVTERQTARIVDLQAHIKKL